MGEELSKIVCQQLNHNTVLSIPNTPLLNTHPSCLRPKPGLSQHYNPPPPSLKMLILIKINY